MRLLSYILLGAICFSCGTKTAVATTDTAIVTTEVTEDKIGTIKRSVLENEFDWFANGYTEYRVDTKTMNKVKPYLNGVSVKVFMGTWCSDSQREVPHFFKAMDEVGFTNIEVVGVTTNKTTPDGLEETYSISNVPTFIFFKNGKEVNRMVEYPLETLEKDMLAIFTTNTYKNPYADF